MARVNPQFKLGPLIEKEKLKADGSNYADWVRSLRIVLRSAKKDYVLMTPIPAAPGHEATVPEQNVHQTKLDDSTAVRCLMTACMESELQGRFENTVPHLIVQELDALYAKHARTERYEVTHAMWNCKMKEGTPVSEHVIKIMRLGQRLTELGFPIPESLGTDIVPMSLPPSFKSFVQNYRMNGMDKSVNELLAMLKNAETTCRLTPTIRWRLARPPVSRRRASPRARAPASLAPILRNPLALALTKILSASTAKLKVTGRGTARSIWQIERSLVLPAKV